MSLEFSMRGSPHQLASLFSTNRQRVFVPFLAAREGFEDINSPVPPPESFTKPLPPLSVCYLESVSDLKV